MAPATRYARFGAICCNDPDRPPDALTGPVNRVPDTVATTLLSIKNEMLLPAPPSINLRPVLAARVRAFGADPVDETTTYVAFLSP